MACFKKLQHERDIEWQMVVPQLAILRHDPIMLKDGQVEVNS